MTRKPAPSNTFANACRIMMNWANDDITASTPKVGDAPTPTPAADIQPDPAPSTPFNLKRDPANDKKRRPRQPKSDPNATAKALSILAKGDW